MAASFFRGLDYWAKVAADPQPGILVYGGEESYRRRRVDVRSWRHWP